MTGPDHYRMAEKLLGYADAIEAEDRGCPAEKSLMREAQVHATLALAAATALHSQMSEHMPIRDADAWAQAAGINDATPDPARSEAANAHHPHPVN